MLWYYILLYNYIVMKKTYKLFIDQYWEIYNAMTIKELKEKYYLTWRISKLYRDKRDWSTVHCWYCIGSLWMDMYIPLEIKR